MSVVVIGSPATFLQSGTPKNLFFANGISALGTFSMGAVALIAASLAAGMFLASRRLSAEGKEHERRISELTGELTAVNEELRKEIVERQRANEARRDPEPNFRELADNIQEIFWVMDVDTKQLIYVNPAFEKIAGRTIASLYTDPLSYRERIHPEDRGRVLNALEEAARRGAYQQEFRIVRPDGTIRWLSSRGFPIRDEQNNVYRIAGVAQDITERKRTEQALRESQAELARVARTVTMGELAASIAHEIEQPLTAIVAAGGAMLHWLARQPPDLGEAREAAAKMVRDANHASTVIERIRDLLKGSSPQMKPFNVNEVIREVLALVTGDLDRGGVVTRTELAPNVSVVLGDRVLLAQVILNLTMNAIDAMNAVTGRLRELRIKSAKNGDGVLIQMQDSGKGIDADQAERIFEPFLTTKAEGIGLGLSISRSIIEAHGGRLWATPGSPHGAIFQFILPASGGTP